MTLNVKVVEYAKVHPEKKFVLPTTPSLNIFRVHVTYSTINEKQYVNLCESQL